MPHRKAILPATVVFLAILPSALQAGTIDFESLPDGTLVTTQYPGLIFTNAIALTAGISLNEFEFPPRSGTTVISDFGGSLSIAFRTPIASFGGYFTYLVPLTLLALDAGGNPVASASSAFGTNLACLAGAPCSGYPGSSPNEWIKVGFTGGIARIIITGNLEGESFALDDAIYTSTVPEPANTFLFTVIIVVLNRCQKRIS
jgi:hypothetical protein